MGEGRTIVSSCTQLASRNHLLSFSFSDLMACSDVFCRRGKTLKISKETEQDCIEDWIVFVCAVCALLLQLGFPNLAVTQLTFFLYFDPPFFGIPVKNQGS